MGKIGDLWVKLGLKKDEYSKGMEEAGREADGGSRHQAGFDEIPAFHYPFTFLMMLRDPSGLTP